MPPQHVSIDVCNWEIHEHVDRTHFPGSLDHFPIQLQSVWIKQAQPATVLLPPSIRKDLLQQNAVAVTLLSFGYFRERLSGQTVLGMAIAVVGVVLMEMGR